MKLRIAWGMCGSFCTFQKVISYMKEIAKEDVLIQPVLSYHAASLDTRFGTAKEFNNVLFEVTNQKPITTIQEAEPIGPKHLADVMLIAPCTGNTLAKLAAGITDSPVLMAAKSHLRNGGPVVVAFSTNDGLTASAQNIGKLLNTKNIYFVPFHQDDWKHKPNSLQADFSRIMATIHAAMVGRQVQPVLGTP